MFQKFLACKQILAADAKDPYQLHRPEIEAEEISILLEVRFVHEACHFSFLA
jgi:hypothetical protein